MTQEERRALFHKKAEIGNRRNNACIAEESYLIKRFKSGDISINDAICLAWDSGCKYGKEHAEELKIFDQ